jgi:hypothetical protein
MISKTLRDLRSSLNQPLKSTDECYIGILQNRTQTYEYVDFFFPFWLILIFSVPSLDFMSVIVT